MLEDPLFTSDEVASVGPAEDEYTGEAVMEIVLTDLGACLLDDYAKNHLMEPLAIVVDGIVLVAPTVWTGRFGGKL